MAQCQTAEGSILCDYAGGAADGTGIAFEQQHNMRQGTAPKQRIALQQGKELQGSRELH